MSQMSAYVDNQNYMKIKKHEHGRVKRLIHVNLTAFS